MADEHRLPRVEQVEREASEWVARLNADDVSADDRARFDAWRRAHALHARVYAAMCETWGRFTAAGPIVRAVAFAELMSEAAKMHTPRLGRLRALFRRSRHRQFR